MTTSQQIARIIRNRSAQGFSPKAIAHQIEKELAMSEQQHLCRDCHQEMELFYQGLNAGKSVPVVTCKNKSCSLWSVTLTTDQYSKLTDAEWDIYRQSVANLKKSLEKLGG